MSDERKEEDREEQSQEEREEREKDKKDREQDHHIPAPPSDHQHRRKHWDHLPGTKRKSIRSFKSPGRK